MNEKQWNWRLWTGLAFSILALLAYVSIFFLTFNRNVVWLGLALFAVAAALLAGGLRRAIRQPDLYRGKVAGPIVTVLSIGLFAVFGWGSYQVWTHFPAAANAPRLGQKAPDFTLPDSGGSTVSLARLLATPMTDASGAARNPKGVLVVFYRGYW